MGIEDEMVPRSAYREACESSAKHARLAKAWQNHAHAAEDALKRVRVELGELDHVASEGSLHARLIGPTLRLVTDRVRAALDGES